MTAAAPLVLDDLEEDFAADAPPPCEASQDGVPCPRHAVYGAIVECDFEKTRQLALLCLGCHEQLVVWGIPHLRCDRQGFVDRIRSWLI